MAAAHTDHATPPRPPSIPGRVLRSQVLSHYFFGAYLAVLWLCLPYLRKAWLPDPASDLYALALGLTHAALYLAPALLATRLVHWVLLRGSEGEEPAGRRRAALAVAVALTSLTCLAIAADCRVYEIFGFHLNGFVVNLVLTPGGIDSMGLGSEGVASFVRSAAAIVAVQVAILWGAHRAASAASGPRAGARAPYRLALLGLLVLTVAERATYAVGEARSSGRILAQASVFPFYHPITLRKLLVATGIAPPRDAAGVLEVDPGSSRLAYPLAPIRVEPPARPLNVVWLVGESLRWDLLDPEVMPAASALARDAWRFTHHYSGGNGTRMGMFSMFYGLHGPYWFEFLAEQRSPILIDELQQQGYQLGLFTSARFSYPEFDRTLFAHVPAAQMHDSEENYHVSDWERGWINDRDRVSDLLDFLARRDRARPFFAFMFFESTHFRYYFPAESVIRTPYAQALDVDELASRANVEQSRARYLNAAHHLDSQIGRILDALRRDGLLDDTIVLITGDHGEEFYEKGRKGHNSEFHEEQIRVPLVLWIPGDGGHTVDRMTSHVDIAATILPLLGVRNAPADYSLGDDLRGDRAREWSVVADWSRIAIVGSQYKLTLPISGVGVLLGNQLATRDDRPLDASGEAFRVTQPELERTIADLHRFRLDRAATLGAL